MTDYPHPSIPGLPADLVIDLDELGGESLHTFIKYPGMVEGDVLYPNWRGCAADGKPVDMAGIALEVEAGSGYTPELGMPFEITNPVLTALDQGWALYSYATRHLGSEQPGPESMRHFLYIGRRPVQMPALPVAQMQDAHDLALDPDLIGQAGAAVWVPPYQSMQVGDKLTLQWRGYWENEPEPPFNVSKTLVAADIGQPLKFVIPRIQVALIEDGHAEIDYRVEYSGISTTSTSARQTIVIEPPTTARLPALRVKGHDSDEPLDPGLFPDGVTLQIDAWPSILDGDQVLLHWISARDSNSTSKSLRVDTSTVDSGFLAIHLEPEWLVANQGETVSVFYQFARGGNALSSAPLTLTIRTPLDLTPPLVERATAEGDAGEFKGVLLAEHATSGAYVKLPEALPSGPDYHYEVHWQGHANGGRHIATEPVSANEPKRFLIPASAVAANMADGEDRRFPVFYRLPGEGQGAQDSAPFNLRIAPLPRSRYPQVQCTQAQGTFTLSLASIPAGGADITLAKWVFMAAGQWLHLEITGVGSTGGAKQLVVRNNTPVTAAEVAKGSIDGKALKAFFTTLQVDQNLTFKARVSFDGGASWVQFNDTNIKLSD